MEDGSHVHGELTPEEDLLIFGHLWDINVLQKGRIPEAETFTSRGCAYQEKGDTARANADFARARELGP